MDSSINKIDKTNGKSIKNDIKDLNITKTNNKESQNSNESTQLNSLEKSQKKNNYKIMEIIGVKCNIIPDDEDEEMIIMGENNTKEIITKGNGKSDSIKSYIHIKIIIGKKGGNNLISFKKGLSKFHDLPKIFVNNIILIKENEFIICSHESIIYSKNLFSNIHKNDKITIYEKSYIGGILINNNLIALTSNSLLSNGEDKLLIYDIPKEKYVINIVGYSFAISQNNLSLINIPEIYKIDQENYIILLCACKKYTKCQKNGILLVIINLDKNVIKYKEFYKTNNFEVFSFCPIERYDNSIFEPKKIEIIDKQYILVGGLDSSKKKGLIKLFKINFRKKIDGIKIEYIQDVAFEKSFKRKGSITSIYQNIKNGKIYVIFSDGNMSSFSPPKIGIKENN